MSTRRGYFVAVEGLDASGKTTLVRRLVTAYSDEGYAVTTVREPGGTRLSERVRRILLDTRILPNARAELFLYLAARAQLVDEVIRPALGRGELVIADRFHLSTIAYQVGGRRLPARAVLIADNLARQGIAPDLTLVLTVSESVAAQRQRQETQVRDRMERESPSFFRGVRAEYRRRSFGKPKHVVIDSTIGADAVFRLAKAQIDRRLRRR